MLHAGGDRGVPTHPTQLIFLLNLPEPRLVRCHYSYGEVGFIQGGGVNDVRDLTQRSARTMAL